MPKAGIAQWLEHCQTCNQKVMGSGPGRTVLMLISVSISHFVTTVACSRGHTHW